MESLKKICGHLEDCVLAELGKDKSMIDAKELGEVVDAIKDIKMAIYYASITEAMEDAEYGKDYNENGRMYYTRRRRDSRGRYMYTEPMDDMMYYDNMEYYSEPKYRMSPDMYKSHSPQEMRDMDRKQGRMYYTENPAMKNNRHLRRYFENKGMGDEGMKLKGLEQDLKEISEEITNLVGDMGNTEKQVLRTKLQNIAQNI